MSLYLHFPFCKQKCAYCDFNSYSNLENLIIPYAKALKIEIKRYLPEPRLIRSVFFGGGTPSYLPAEILAEVLLFVKEHFRLKSDAEITLETNPGTLAGPELAFLKAAGFNRLSFGLQASQDRLLNSIGRIHSWTDFINIYDLGRAADFSNLGVDIIFGLPGQTLQDWGETLERVVFLKPEHISAYGLQLEEGTKLAALVEEGIFQLPSEDEVVKMMEQAMNYLPEKGYRHYEVSNYAKPGYESIHNLGYWRGNDYLGFGAGAYSTISNERWFNIKEPWRYIEAAAEDTSVVAEREKLDHKTKATEALMLGLRLRSGVNLRDYEAEYGINLIKAAEPYLKSLLEQKLLVLKEPNLALTDAGIMVSNSVISSLLVGV